jgi:hypothetical protein
MANSKYTQVSDLLLAGRFNWRTDRILGLLCTNVTFDAADTVVSDLDGSVVSQVPIQGRDVGPGGQCLGYPAFFSAVSGDTPFQVVLVQDLGSGDPNLIGFFDEDENGGELIAQNDGTFVVRPGLPNTDVYNPDARVWMVV